MNEVRIDKWMWATRIFKTRTVAADACKKGRVMIKGVNVKPSHMLECQALTFMNRDGPSRFEWILGESAGHFFFDFFRLGIDGIFDVFPLFAVDGYCVAFFVGHFNVVLTDLRDCTDLAVEVKFVGR